MRLGDRREAELGDRAGSKHDAVRRSPELEEAEFITLADVKAGCHPRVCGWTWLVDRRRCLRVHDPEASVVFYERLGFAVTSEVTPFDVAAPIWTMVRRRRGQACLTIS